MPSAGTRVRTVDNERLDKNDFDAIFSLIYGWAQLASGMTDGVAEGVLSPPSVTYEVVGPVRQIRLGECTLYAAQNEGAATNRAIAYPVVYDPTSANQLQTTVDLSAFSNAQGVLWWTVDLTDTDLDNRRVWEAGYPDGRAVAMLTRQRERIRFTTSADFDTAPAIAGTWYKMGVFFLPTSGAPTVRWGHAFDYGWTTYMNPPSDLDSFQQRWVGQWIFQDGYDSADNTGRSFGLPRMLSQLAMYILTMLDSDYTFNPETLEFLTTGSTDFATGPDRGIVQLDADLATAEADIVTLQADVAEIPNLQAVRVLWTAQMNSSGTAADVVFPFAADSYARPGTGEYVITFDSGAAPGAIISQTTGIPIVTVGSATNSVMAKAGWTGTYELTVRIYENAAGVSTAINSAFNVAIMGQYD